jgi:integrase/recombinase XerC
VAGTRRIAGSAALVLVDGATPLRPEPALFEAMLEGWRRRQAARRLSGPLIEGRVRLVRRFQSFTGAWPWQWTPAQAEAWVASGGWAHSTVRSYEGALAVFLDFVCDPRYGWVAECEQLAGGRPVQVFHEGNAAVHASDYEGRPERRPLTRGELQAFFDAADAHVDKAAGSRRKGWLSAFRDATLFKVIYGWGLRRREAAMLDVADFTANPAASRAWPAGGVPGPVRQGHAGQPAAAAGGGHRDAVGGPRRWRSTWPTCGPGSGAGAIRRCG